MKSTGEVYERLPEIWQHERTLPQWFADASGVWRDSLQDEVGFIDACEKVWGLFDGARLMLCVYFEKEEPGRQVEIHLSVLHKIRPSKFIKMTAQLRDTLFHSGVKIVRGWVLTKNTSLCRLLAEVGFRDTGLRMDKGMSRGRALSWRLAEVSVG